MTPTDEHLGDLAAIRVALDEVERQASELRTRRNELIVACLAGATERAVSKVAGVSPAYVHRVRQFAGRPPSGHLMSRITGATDQ